MPGSDGGRESCYYALGDLTGSKFLGKKTWRGIELLIAHTRDGARNIVLCATNEYVYTLSKSLARNTLPLIHRYEVKPKTYNC